MRVSWRCRAASKESSRVSASSTLALTARCCSPSSPRTRRRRATGASAIRKGGRVKRKKDNSRTRYLEAEGANKAEEPVQRDTRKHASMRAHAHTTRQAMRAREHHQEPIHQHNYQDRRQATGQEDGTEKRKTNRGCMLQPHLSTWNSHVKQAVTKKKQRTPHAHPPHEEKHKARGNASNEEETERNNTSATPLNKQNKRQTDGA